MGDKYRSFLYDEADDIEWRHGGPPTYDDVNKLFEDGRTKEWPKGSLEEIVQNAVKSWEMELSHKTRLKDFKTINPEKFKLFVNGRTYAGVFKKRWDRKPKSAGIGHSFPYGKRPVPALLEAPE
ncbi:hypothetical protein SO802_008004 [Lithocarpus litseifolius]|uniref:Uncharacterized protein n=1 Tax=Lithocarpus litseifolius TaxID=425828 RepID=A0AAW2DR68_9ROSI